MLWKKESNRRDALYIDMYAKCQFASQVNRMFNQTQSKVNKSMLRKNNTVSLKHQQQGDKYSEKNEWNLAIHKYDDSLCYAEERSENISLAYAKRSKCFFQLEMYNECLKDIELAKDAGYPTELMPDLEQRKADCLAHLDNSDGAKSSERVAKLSFEPDEKFPCMANVLKVEKNTDGKHSVIAKQDIDVGKTIIVEDTLKFIHINFERRCTICLKKEPNLVPCKKCAIAKFCSIECQQHFFHENECGVMFSNDIQENGTIMKNLRGIYTVINLFESVDELMDFVEQTISSDANELPGALVDARSKYCAFLKQRTGPEFDDQNLALMMISEFKLILKNSKVNAMFKSKKHNRFLQHLIAQHVLISQHNSRVLMCADPTNPFNLFSCFGVMAAYFNHSCAPNAMITFQNEAKWVYVLVRPVKKGEEVLISWVPFPLEWPTKERKKILWTHKGMIIRLDVYLLYSQTMNKLKESYLLVKFKKNLCFSGLRCDCLRCIGAEADWAHRNRINLDIDFISIMSTAEKLTRKSSASEISLQIEKCVALLKKYGNIDWCFELGEAIMAFIKAYDLHVSN